MTREHSLAEPAGRFDFQTFFQSVPDPYVVLRPDLTVVAASDAYLHATRTRREELLGRGLFDVFPSNPADPHATGERNLRASLEIVLRTRAPHTMALQKHDLRRPDAEGGGFEERYWSPRNSPVFGPDGEVAYIIHRVEDVTEQVQAQRQSDEQARMADEARSEAEAASRAKDEFLAMLGHELRNPLAPIMTALQLMKLRGDGKTAREQAIIERQARHLVHLVDDLLDVSRIARGKIKLRRAPVELGAVVTKAVEMASPLLEQRQHTLTVDVPAVGMRLEADEVRLAQVIANLLTNAAKYTEPGGQVTVRATREAGEVVLRVQDTGVGIAPEVLPHIFDMFVQGPRSSVRPEGGLGLGLTLVRSLVALHGGSVSATSEGLGRGSEFVVRLPALSAAAEEARARPLAPPRPRAGAPRRVLVVDDNVDAAELLGEVLEQEGHDVTLAHDGPRALEVAAWFRPEVAVLDIGLPVMDGYELGSRLREQFGETLRLIAVTGYGQEHDRSRSVRAGFSDHLVKPIEVGRLTALVTGAALR